MASVATAVALAACGSTEDQVERTGSVRYAATGEPVAAASITPLMGSRSADGALAAFAADPNTAPVTTDDDGRFDLDYGVVPTVAGIQITIDVPSVDGSVVGRLDWRGEADPAQPGDFSIPEPRWCVGGEGCGTPLLPDLVPLIRWDDLSPDTEARLRPGTDSPVSAGLLPASTAFVSEENGRRLLRFATVALNQGDGALDVIAEPDGDGEDSVATWQRIWTDSWNFTDVVSGRFIHHPTHDHIHFDAFERYRLLTASGELVASSEKVSFCLRDSVRFVEETPPAVGTMLLFHDDCGERQQTINPGFGDHYHAMLDDQWIDVTDVPSGRYVVEITVDPLDLIVESDESNNTGTFEMIIDPPD